MKIGELDILLAITSEDVISQKEEKEKIYQVLEEIYSNDQMNIIRNDD